MLLELECLSLFWFSSFQVFPKEKILTQGDQSLQQKIQIIQLSDNKLIYNLYICTIFNKLGQI